jgi:hypothetical protein
MTRLSPQLIAKVKAEALRRRRTECELVEAMLTRELARSSNPRSLTRVLRDRG